VFTFVPQTGTATKATRSIVPLFILLAVIGDVLPDIDTISGFDVCHCTVLPPGIFNTEYDAVVQIVFGPDIESV
jgi:hypothetical protein